MRIQVLNTGRECLLADSAEPDPDALHIVTIDWQSVEALVKQAKANTTRKAASGPVSVTILSDDFVICAMCPRCKTNETEWLTGSRSDEAEVCLPCRRKAEKCTSYLAEGGQAWGRGSTIKEAKANHVQAQSRRKGSKWKGRLHKIVGDDQPYVDGAGMLTHYGTAEIIERVD